MVADAAESGTAPFEMVEEETRPSDHEIRHRLSARRGPLVCR